MLQASHSKTALRCALAMLISFALSSAAPLTAAELLTDAPTTELPVQDSLRSQGILVVPTTTERLPTLSDDQHWVEEPPPVDGLLDMPVYEEWTSQWLPTGLIYHPYWAGARQPRLGLNAFHEANDSRNLWDATLGGQVGFWRYGNCDSLRPQGYQLDFYGAAIARLDVENQQDLDATDYIFGMPLTYGIDDWQFKIGYAHISSHLGDEFAVRNPGALADRINYVRDSIVFGASYFLTPAWRAYGELGYAFHCSGGAEPLEAQFGTELSQPGPTGSKGTPFLAINAALQQENDFGGQLSAQLGWLRRGFTGQTLRFGGHFLGGKSSQTQFFNQSEQQFGLGLWYDF